jgi:N6-L-threonylcarbamoyladenine synthase
MIAYAGMQRLKAGVFEPLVVKAVPRWPLDTLDPV